MTSNAPSSGASHPWLELPLVSGFLGGLPATVAAGIFGMSVQKPLTERIVPELAHLQQSLAERLELTAPLTLGVAAIAFLWIRGIPDHSGVRFLLSTGALMLSSWLGKTFAFGLSASVDARPGEFGGSWQTHGIALLENYYHLYGALQFFLSLACGVILGGYWALRLRQRFG